MRRSILGGRRLWVGVSLGLRWRVVDMGQANLPQMGMRRVGQIIDLVQVYEPVNYYIMSPTMKLMSALTVASLFHFDYLWPRIFRVPSTAESFVPNLTMWR